MGEVGLDPLDVVHHVSVNHQQVPVPIVVEVQKARAETQQKTVLARQARPPALVPEQPVSLVTVEGVGLQVVVGHHDVQEAVPVVVGRIHPHPGFRLGLAVVAGPR